MGARSARRLSRRHTTVRGLRADAARARASIYAAASARTVQSTTLDDVFLHYTGKQLRDEASQGKGYDVSHLYNR